ncbi:DUF4145 domain-containing protein [Hymenobacter convexus]|uniref:DUF4145 domain-containing protein n=1 Tax=Hymenobacter sp. CA1UV-4 TaxID=3063782 RepID=UPI00271398F4|nr:DUF4145 domain-containing protein [Hymenobacter sp. CA1UV-4]MDO7853586.1 DUF4145 domain-containing protein [Hymenobacter sp. CA1UV-4]
MKLNRESLQSPITVGSIPEWFCPYCGKESLKGDKSNFKSFESIQSKYERANDNWEPDWIEGIFCGLLKCSNVRCKEQVVVSGRMAVEDFYDLDEEMQSHYNTEVLYPLFFVPAVPLFRVSKDVPKQIAAAVTEVFSVFWHDKSSCGNKIRRVIELIVDDKKVTKTYIDKKRKRREYTLHARIELFGKRGKTAQEQKSAELLMAIKWIGNSGSHSNVVLQQNDILDGLEILSHVLELLYDKEHLRIYKLSKEYIKSKGPLKRPLFSTKHIK